MTSETDLYRHKKSGAFYRKLSEVVDATNSRNGTRAIVYCRVDSGGVPQFVREAMEFEEKFERAGIDADDPGQCCPSCEQFVCKCVPTSNERLLQAIETGLQAMRDCQRNAHGGKVCFDGDEWHERWALLSEARRMLRGAVETEERPCTCHPDDSPPRPCPQKYALSECRKAAEHRDQVNALALECAQSTRRSVEAIRASEKATELHAVNCQKRLSSELHFKTPSPCTCGAENGTTGQT